MEDIMTLEGLQERLKPFLKLLLLEVIEAFREAQRCSTCARRGEESARRSVKDSCQGCSDGGVTAEESQQFDDTIEYIDSLPQQFSDSVETLNPAIHMRDSSLPLISTEELKEEDNTENMLKVTTVMTCSEIQNLYPEIIDEQPPNSEQVHQPEEKGKEGITVLSWMKDKGESSCPIFTQTIAGNICMQPKVDEEAMELDMMNCFQPGSSLLEDSETRQCSMESKSSSLEQDVNQLMVPSLVPHSALTPSKVGDDDSLQRNKDLIETQNSNKSLSLDSSSCSGVEVLDSHHNSFKGCLATDKDDRPSEMNTLNMESTELHVLDSCSVTNSGDASNKESPQSLLSSLQSLTSRHTHMMNTTHLSASLRGTSPIPVSNDKMDSLPTKSSVCQFPIQEQKCQNTPDTMSLQETSFQESVTTGPKSCPLCSKVFQMRKTLQKHMQRHYKRPYRCSECLKSYRIREKLKLHWKTHAGEAPFSCRLCGFTCRTLKRLDSHLSNIVHD